jgi:spore maturation protein CgeB
MQHVPVALGSSAAIGSPFTTRALAPVMRALPRLDERRQQRIARSALDNECEIVISIEERILPGVVRTLRRGGAKVALWFTDALVGMGRQTMLLPRYDAIFVKDPYLVHRLRSVLDLPVFYLPEACNPRYHRPLATPGTDKHLVIAGNMYPSRIRLLERLLAEGVPLKLYGPGFPRWVGQTALRQVHTGRLIFGEDKARVFGSAAAVLNNLHPTEVNSVNARLFEAAGSGAAVLTEFRPTLPESFAIGDEVLAFHDFDELVGQANRLLSEDGLSAKLGGAAAQRAHADHTYEKRLAVLLETLS